MKFKLDRDGVSEFLNGSELEAYLKKVGAAVAEQANLHAPVGETGNLSQSHYEEIDRTKDRLVVRVRSDLGYSGKVAANTGYLTRALDGADVE